MLTDQWYVDAKTLAIPAIEAVEEGKLDLSQKDGKTYFEWLQNIQPWCVFRVNYGGDTQIQLGMVQMKIFAAETEAEAKEGRKVLGYKVSLRQEVDVLETLGFSSALWPFVTLDWP